MIDFLSAALALLLSAGLSGGDDKDPVRDKIDSTVVLASRADDFTPVANSFVGRIELRNSASFASMPAVMKYQPSVVTTEEGGTGLGYTSIRIRGVGGYQTNVTLNGFTLNDAESQEVFWVNIPGLNNILGSVQLQRGLGTSAAGSGAFGASINMSGNAPDVAGGGLDVSAGSFGTVSTTLNASSGVLPGGFYAAGTYSYGHSDGYIRNAPADVQSIYGVAGWRGGDNSLKFTFLQGNQRTGITWEGVPFETYRIDRRFNKAPGATDNYVQSHFQLNYAHRMESGSLLGVAFNYTDGKGFYSYPGTKDAMDNGLFAFRSDYNLTAGRIDFKFGMYLSHYQCDHYGEDGSVEWYRNKASKGEADAWARAGWKVSEKVNLYGDVQYRGAFHKMDGPDEYLNFLDYSGRWDFLNPRVGINVAASGQDRFRFFAALGHREPSRSDLQVFPECRPETMYDIEAAYTFTGRRLGFEINLYAMEYRDMLLETGALNPGGYAIKSNVPRGYRRGLELSAAYKLTDWFSLEGNACLSLNKYGEKVCDKDVLLSPSSVAGAVAVLSSEKMGQLRIYTRCVGRQYWDNSSLKERIVPAYFVADVSYLQNFYFNLGPERKACLGASVFLNNVLDRQYYAYAYSGGVYPAAPFNLSVKLSLSIF